MHRIVRGPTEDWIGNSPLHLTPAQKRFCNRVKEEIVTSQKGKTRIKADYEDGHFPTQHYVNTSSHLKEFLSDCLEIVLKGPTVIILDTRGHSDCWVKKRRKLDGDAFFKNEESSGVTAIIMKVHVKGKLGPNEHGGKGPMAFINAQMIAKKEMNGEPILPPIFFQLLRHPNTVVVGENIVKHLKRIENSFTDRLDQVMYVATEDLTNRYMEHGHFWDQREVWEFSLDPLKNHGLLWNFHRVYDNERGGLTYRRNPYETPVELWDDLSQERIAQVAHALNKVFFGEVLVRRILEAFVHRRCSLSIMVQVYPDCKKEARIDFRQKAALEAWRDRPRRPDWVEDADGFPMPNPDPIQPDYHVYDEETVWPLQPGNTKKLGNRTRTPGEPGCPRAEQRETKKRRRREDAYFRESRELAVSDVSEDDDDADEAIRSVKRKKADVVARGNRVAQIIIEDEAKAKSKNRICDPSDWSRLLDLAKEDEYDDALFFSTVLKNLDPIQNEHAVRNLSAFYSDRSDAKKETVINFVAASGFFNMSSPTSAFIMMQKMQLKRFHPSSLLQLRAKPHHIAGFVAKLDVCMRIEVINFLSEFYGLPNDERHVQLEACEFYWRGNRTAYIKSDEQVDGLLRRVCAACNIGPGEEYFRAQRHRFICGVIEEGRQGRVSVENAAKMIVAQAGDDGWTDGKDAAVMAAPWPRVAKAVHAHYYIAGLPTLAFHCDENLSGLVKCRKDLHDLQTDTTLNFLRDMSEVEAMKTAMATVEVLVLVMIENRDPRAFVADPQLVFFTAPGKGTYAYFPISVSGGPKEAIENFIATKLLFSRKPMVAKRYFAKPDRPIRTANGANLLQEHAGGRDDPSLTDFVWELRFCTLTKSEWMTDPLTEDQHSHVAYLAEALRLFVEKIGLDAVKAIEKAMTAE